MEFLKLRSFLYTHKKYLCDQTVKAMKYLCVAEKNDAAKNIAAILSRGASNRREGLSRYNKIYEFDCQVRGQQAKLTMTSVSGHLLNYAFVGTFKNWKACSPLELFDAPLRKVCSEDFQNIKKTLEREVRNCSGLIIWTDCDREGENIGYEVINVCTAIKPNLTVYRAKFSEITGPSIFRALNNLGEPNKNVSDAVDVRQELDLRTGAAFTRLQTLRLQKVFPGTLADKLISYGSCQFPTLGFVVERYQAIENFIPERFWKIVLKHTIKELTTDFLWRRERLFEKGAVEAILDICQENPLARVESVKSKQKNKWRPLPLDTVEMEKTISRKLRINAKEVMKIAEKLYTQGFISYPRTETNIFPKELNLQSLVEQQREDNRWGPFANKVLEWGTNPRHGKKSDQAHPPIHPTKYAPNLQGNEQRVYEYIVRHFLASVSRDAIGHETVVDVDLAGEKFTAKGLIVLEKNYLEVYIYEKWNAKEINAYQNGDTFTPTELDMVESSTSPPKLLTEADLIALMEKHGIGTDATHAEHIETIKTREYVGLQENMYFVPATLGMGLIEGYNKIGLEISLAKPNLRADFENNLKLICEGRRNAEEVRTEQVQKYKEVYKMVSEKMRLIDTSLATRLNDQPAEYTEQHNSSNSHKPVLKCPKCGFDMIFRDRKNGQGKFLSCSGYPDCKNAVWFSTAIVNVEVTDVACRECGPDVKKVNVQFKQNPFIGEPNPNVLCIGGCDAAVLSALDISINSVKKQNNPQLNPVSNNRTNNITVNRPTIVNGILTRPPTNNTNTNNNRTRDYGNTSDSGYSSRNSNTMNTTRAATMNQPPRSNVLPGPSNNRTLNNNSTSMNRSNNNGNGDEEIVCHCDKPAILLTVRKEGPNKGRKFYKCVEGTGNGGCDFFLWAPDENAPVGNSSAPGDDDDEMKCNCYMAAALRTVSREGPNTGRQFYCCPKPKGESCSYFKWADESDDSGGGRGGQNKWKGKMKGRGGKANTNTKKPPPYGKKPPTKRKCGICGTEGHTRNKCPNV